MTLPPTVPVPRGSPDSKRSTRRAVVIAGGSIAALETLGAVTRLAGDRVSVTLIAPEERFIDRPRALRTEREGACHPAPSLRDVVTAFDAEHVRDRITWVDPASHAVHTATGARFGYDALVVAVGARASAAYQDALTLEPTASAAVAELLTEVRAGRVGRVAFVVPERSGWLLALYETVLATARAAREAGSPPHLIVLTAERAPLAIFGRRASQLITEMLEQHGVRVLADVHTEVPAPGRVCAHGPDGSCWETEGLDRVVAAALLCGPFLRGLPIGDSGFIPIDPYCRVPGRHWIFAAGDVTTYPVKHGGIAAQQADVVGRGIATLAGVPDVRTPFRPRLEARLVTGDGRLYLGADLIGGEPFGSMATSASGVATGPKVFAAELGRVLEAAGPSAGRDAEPDIEHRS